LILLLERTHRRKRRGVKLVGRRTALNVVQKLPGLTFADNPVIVGVTAIDIYTVPTGRKALLTSLFTRLVSLGAGTLITFQLITPTNLRLVRTTVAETVLTEKLTNTTGILMQAGTIIRLDGDSGADNSSVGFDIKVEETSA